MKKIITAFTIIIVLFILSFFSSSEKCVLIFDNKYDNVFNFKYSPDGEKIASLVRDNKGFKIIQNGIESEEFIGISDFNYSQNGKKIAYTAVKDWNNYTNILFENGKKIDKDIGMFKYSPNGKEISYIKYIKGKEILIKGGIKIEEEDKIINFKYSPDGKSFTYMTKNKLIKDGKEINYADEIIDFKYSPDGKSFAYLVKSISYFLIKDGERSKPYNDIINFEYSSDGKNIYFWGSNNRKGLLVKNFEKIKSDNGLIINDFEYIWDFKIKNNKYIYTAKKDGKWFFVNNGKKSIGYDWIKDLNFSDKGTSFSYTAKKDGKWFLIKDGLVIANNFEDYNMKYSPKGNSYGYITQKHGKTILIINRCISTNLITNYIEKIFTFLK